MKDTAALIIAQDCAKNALTLRGYNMLVAVSSPYVTDEREPTDVDALFAYYILRGKYSNVLDAGFIDSLAKEADAQDPATTVATHEAVKEAMAPASLAVQGMTGGDKKDVTPTNGLVPALMLRCFREFGWTADQALDTPLGTLLVVLREQKIQDGKAISYAQMEIIDQMQAAQAKAAQEKKEANDNV